VFVTEYNEVFSVGSAVSDMSAVINVLNLTFCIDIRTFMTDYGLDDQGGEFESRWWQEFSLLHVVQTGSGAHQTSYRMSTGGSSSGVKRPGREDDHSPPTSAEVKETWVYTSTPLYVFIA
jgi:hypothetical protein